MSAWRRFRDWAIGPPIPHFGIMSSLDMALGVAIQDGRLTGDQAESYSRHVHQQLLSGAPEIVGWAEYFRNHVGRDWP